MSRALDDLCEGLRPQAFEVIARLIEARVPILIVDILRSPAEHAVNLANGTSKATHSKHVAATNSACIICHGTGSHAFDLCPYDEFSRVGSDKLLWNVRDGENKILREWQLIGFHGKRFGFRWGGDWKDPFDPGHLELP